MNGKNNKPYAILVFGAPACGKTEFATKFSEHFNLPHLDFCELKAKHKVSRPVALFLTEQIIKSNQNIVIEGATDTEKDRAELRNLLHKYGYQPVLIWIQTDLSTIKSRLTAKLGSGKKAKEFFDTCVSKIEAPSRIENAIILSGKYTFNTQLKTVLSHLSKQ